MAINRLDGFRAGMTLSGSSSEFEGEDQNVPDWIRRARLARNRLPPRIPLVRIDMTAVNWGQDELE